MNKESNSNYNSTGFASYLATFSSTPILTAAEEACLMQRVRTSNDKAAMDEMVKRSLRFVVSVARKYRGYGLLEEDLVQEGTVGLLEALRRFDPDVGVRFVSYAVHWIRAHIHDYIIRNVRIVRTATTHDQKKLFFNLRSMKKSTNWLGVKEAESIAQELNVSPAEVLKAEQAFLSQDQSLHADADETGVEHWLAAENADPAVIVEHQDWQSKSLPQLRKALSALDARAGDIVRKRALSDGKATRLNDLGARYGVTAERIRQIERGAFAQLRSSISPSYAP